MNRRLFVASTASLAAGGLIHGVSADAEQIDTTKTIVEAAAAFLRTLANDQRAVLLFPLVSQPVAKPAYFKGGKFGNVTFVGEQYGQSMWSNFPVSDVPRPGIRLGNLSIRQHSAFMELLQVLLSARGFQKVLDIMGSDQALADGGTPFAAGIAAYTIGFFGAPSLTTSSLTTTPWMIQFGGHHLALNITIAGVHGVLAPVLTGAQPAVYTSNGKTVRALANENDKGFALLDTLDKDQRRQAIIDHDVSELVLGPGHDGEWPQAQGLDGAAMNAGQRAMLLDLISEWAGMINDAYAAPRLREIRDGLNETYFAWSGPATHEPGRNGASYFRVHGPRLMIEFSPQQVGGDPTMHVHTIYRDPANAYGRSLS